MQKILELAKQRRIWAGLLGGITFLATTFGIVINFDTETLSTLLANLGVAVASLVEAVLTIHSYFYPKK